MSEPLPRVSGRLGEPVALNVRFFRNGVPTDPFAIRRVRIYRSSVSEENLITEIPFVLPGDPTYPLPATKPVDDVGDPIPGAFVLEWDVPDSGIPVPDIFFDVWDFLCDDCRDASGGGGAGTDGFTDVDPCLDDEETFTSLCNKFFLFPNGWFLDDGLEVPRFGFEALDLKFHQPECRTLEVGLMPLPLYDFDFNFMAPLIPQMQATFTMESENNEVLINQEPMTIGLRQGSFRTNPFTLQYKLNTVVVESTGCPILKGTYKYRVALQLPNGETRVSPDFTLQIS